MLLPLAAHAQVDSLVFATDSAWVKPEQQNELRITVDALAFFRDNEYNTKHVVRGYTLPGLWLQPTVSYQPLRQLKIEMGAFMIHYWGAKYYPNANYTNLESVEAVRTTKAFLCVPVFRGNLQLTPNVNIVLGTLYGKAAHQLSVPLYNDEMNITSDPETGVQIMWHNRWLDFDTWVNWQDFIFKSDNNQERFAYGLSTRFYPRNQHQAKWYFPLQLVMQHIGGEINSEAPDRSIKTWLNAAWAAGVNVPLQTRIPVTLGGEVGAQYYSQQKGKVLPFDYGYGITATARAKVWNFLFTASYWRAHQFIPIFGSPLYSAMSQSQSGVTLKDPSMALIRAEYAHTLGHGCSWGVRLDFDLHFENEQHNSIDGTITKGKSTNDLAAGIYLRITPSFLVKKFKTTQAR